PTNPPLTTSPRRPPSPAGHAARVRPASGAGALRHRSVHCPRKKPTGRRGWSAAPTRSAPLAALTRHAYRRNPAGRQKSSKISGGRGFFCCWASPHVIDFSPEGKSSKISGGRGFFCCWASPHVIDFSPEGKLDFLSIIDGGLDLAS